jgi:hypothetical protein
MKTDLNKEVTIQVKLTYNFVPADFLPDDFEGTREDVVEWFRDDVADNFEQFVSKREIYDNTVEISEGQQRIAELAPNLLDALRSLKTIALRISDLRHNGQDISDEDWSDLYDETLKARGLIDKTTSEPTLAS